MADELTLNVPDGLNAHLMTEAHNPPRADQPYARVGYWLGVDGGGAVAEVVWFPVVGDAAAAQAVLDHEVTPALLALVELPFAAESADAPEPERAIEPAPKRRGRPKKGD